MKLEMTRRFVFCLIFQETTAREENNSNEGIDNDREEEKKDKVKVISMKYVERWVDFEWP